MAIACVASFSPVPCSHLSKSCLQQRDISRVSSLQHSRYLDITLEVSTKFREISGFRQVCHLSAIIFINGWFGLFAKILKTACFWFSDKYPTLGWRDHAYASRRRC